MLLTSQINHQVSQGTHIRYKDKIYDILMPNISSELDKKKIEIKRLFSLAPQSMKNKYLIPYHTNLIPPLPENTYLGTLPKVKAIIVVLSPY